MTRELIAVDVDDVLCCEREGIMRYINQKYGQSHTLDDYNIKGDYWGYWESVWKQDDETAERWLNEHFPETFKQIEFVKLWSKDKKVTKAEICDHLGATFLVDDSVEHCNVAAEAGLQAILFGDYGWNRSPDRLNERIVRANGWSDVLRYFDARG